LDLEEVLFIQDDCPRVGIWLVLAGELQPVCRVLSPQVSCPNFLHPCLELLSGVSQVNVEEFEGADPLVEALVPVHVVLLADLLGRQDHVRFVGLGVPHHKVTPDHGQVLHELDVFVLGLVR